SRMHVEDGVDNAADDARHPERTERRGVGNRAAVVGSDVEEPLRFGHVAVPTGNPALLSDPAQLPFLGRASLDGPERRGSKKSFCPRSAAGRELRYVFSVSAGNPGKGDSVLTTAHSWLERASLSVLAGPIGGG